MKKQFIADYLYLLGCNCVDNKEKIKYVYKHNNILFPHFNSSEVKTIANIPYYVFLNYYKKLSKENKTYAEERREYLIDKFTEHILNGMYVKDISKIYSMSKDTIRKYVKLNGHEPTQRKRDSWTEEEENYIIHKYKYYGQYYETLKDFAKSLHIDRFYSKRSLGSIYYKMQEMKRKDLI